MVELSLTKRQREIFDFIKTYSARHGYPPTVRDIGKAIGLTSSSTVHAHLANLEKLGLIRRDSTTQRALERWVDAAQPDNAARSGDAGGGGAKERGAVGAARFGPRSRGCADPGRGEHRG